MPSEGRVARAGYYSPEGARSWLRRWPEVHLYVLRRDESGGPPPSRLERWPLEFLLCVKCDLEMAVAEVPAMYRDMTIYHYRDDESYPYIARHRFGGVVGEDTVAVFARAGAKIMIAYLCGEKQEET